jgi:pyruvate/2-oxoglutarate dehydrogenase complex dihydrolipoamide dehydrogenase (E3) component
MAISVRLTWWSSGTGPGGESLTAQAADAGLDVVAVEKHLVGGECPYYGCTPSEIMLRTAETLAEAGRAAAIAGDVDVRPDWRRVAERTSTEATDGWSDTVAVDHLQQAGATVLHGAAGWPVLTRWRSSTRTAALRGIRRAPESSSTRYAPSVTHDRRARGGSLLDQSRRRPAPALSRRLIVLGGGAAAVELAQAIARFGTDVTIVETGTRLLKREEPESSEALRRALENDGIRMLLDSHTTRVDYDGAFTVRLRDGAHLHAERLRLATGRTPNLDDIGLETLNLAPESVPIGDRLWLIGDAAGQGAYTYVSMHHSEIVHRQILGLASRTTPSPVVPRVTFTDPEIAAVGLTEAQARGSGLAVASAHTDLGSRGFTHGEGTRAGFVKLVADAQRQTLVGATAVGPYAGEVLSMLTLALHAEVPIAKPQSMIYAYSTFHRAVSAADL